MSDHPDLWKCIGCDICGILKPCDCPDEPSRCEKCGRFMRCSGDETECVRCRDLARPTA
jgi:hypothetical protein